MVYSSAVSTEYWGGIFQVHMISKEDMRIVDETEGGSVRLYPFVYIMDGTEEGYVHLDPFV